MVPEFSQSVFYYFIFLEVSKNDVSLLADQKTMGS